MDKKPTVYGRTYYSDEEFILEQELMMEYLHTVTNDHVLLYRVDRGSMPKANVYGEAKPNEKIFMPKLEIPCKANVVEEQPNFQAQGIGYTEMLTIDFSVPELAFDDGNIKIQIGDYVRWKDRFFEVVKLHNIPDSSAMSKNYKHKMRKFRGIMAKEDTLPKKILNDLEIN